MQLLGFNIPIKYDFRLILYVLGFLVAVYLLKKLINFLNPNRAFKWGLFNYLSLKKLYNFNSREMRFLKNIARQYKVRSSFYLLGRLSSLDHYLSLYVLNIFQNKKLSPSQKNSRLAFALEIRRKFTVIPSTFDKLKSSRQISAGTSIRISLKGKGFFQSKIGDSRYTHFLVPVKSKEIMKHLKNEKNVVCSISRRGDARYRFKSKISLISEKTDPMFVQLKHSKSLKRTQLRRDIRQNCRIYTDLEKVKTNTATKKGSTVYKSFASNKVNGYIKNISSGGAAVELKEPLNVGDIYKLQFRIFEEKVEIPARVIRFTPLAKYMNSGYVHLKFINISLKARNQIQLFTYRLHPSYLSK